MSGYENKRLVKDPVPVLDLHTTSLEFLAGYTDGSGRTWVLRRGPELGDGEPERVSLVNLGAECHGVAAAYVPHEQLRTDPGLYRFVKRINGTA
ncbi:MAG: hypothetical protein HY516_04520 [Candidatus Aenigmarchaeota archaeon]|nr:hypothetical protein [Candidatus Aenigmarchaeota archaeon]